MGQILGFLGFLLFFVLPISLGGAITLIIIKILIDKGVIKWN